MARLEARLEEQRRVAEREATAAAALRVTVGPSRRPGSRGGDGPVPPDSGRARPALPVVSRPGVVRAEGPASARVTPPHCACLHRGRSCAPTSPRCSGSSCAAPRPDRPLYAPVRARPHRRSPRVAPAGSRAVECGGGAAPHRRPARLARRGGDGAPDSHGPEGVTPGPPPRTPCQAPGGSLTGAAASVAQVAQLQSDHASLSAQAGQQDVVAILEVRASAPSLLRAPSTLGASSIASQHQWRRRRRTGSSQSNCGRQPQGSGARRRRR